MVLMFASPSAGGDGIKPPLPQAFQEQWCAYRSSDFNLLTDLSHRPALATIRGLNRFRRMFLALFPDATGNASLPVTMVVFRRARDFTELAGSSRYAGVTLPSMHEYRLLATRAQPGAATDNLWHEYTHYLLRTRTNRSYPIWYEEGLATYLGAAESRRRSVLLGNLPHRHVQHAVRDDSVSFPETIEATSVLELSRAELISYYAKAWLLTHFILHGHEAEFPDWRPALDRYLTATQRDFEAAFGQSPAELGELLKRYLALPRLPQTTIELPRTEAPPPKRACLTEEQRDYELALSVTPLNRRVAVRVLEAMEPEAATLAALSQAVWNDHGRALALVNQALELDPANANANIQFAQLLVRDCAFSSASGCIGRWARSVQRYRRVLERYPGRYDAAYGLGVAYLHTGRASLAMPYLRLAYEKMPWEVAVNFYLGEGYRITGDPRATAHLRNALHWASDALWQERARFALRRLREEAPRSRSDLWRRSEGKSAPAIQIRQAPTR